MGRRLGALLGGLVAVALLWAAPGAGAAQTCKGAETPVAESGIADAERTMLCLVNVYRAANGVPKVAMEQKLLRAARGHSEDMVAKGYFCHEYKPGCEGYKSGDPHSTPSSRLAAQGYDGGWSENIAADSRTSTSPQSMFEQWRESPGHNRNMLDLHGYRSYVFGMGFALGYAPDGPGTSGATGTQMFGFDDTGATDTGSDLVVDDGTDDPGDPGDPGTPPATTPPGDPAADSCADAVEDKRAAKQKFRDAKKKVKRLKKKVKRKSGKPKRKAKRRLQRAKKAKRRAKRERNAARNEVAMQCRTSSSRT